VRGAQIVDGLADPAKVYQDAQRLVTDDNKNYGPFILVAILAERIKKPAEAVALYDKALARQPKAAIAYSRKADILLAAGRASDALAIYDAAIKAGLDLAVFHRKMGMILEFLDRSDEALAQYRIARQAAPDDKVARYLLAGMLARMGKADEAEAELRALLARFPNEVEALCRLAIISINKNDLASAEKAVAQAQQVDAAALAPKALLAEIRYRQKRTDEAERLARAILAERPDASDVRLLLAHILSSRKQFKEAVAELKSILAADPENLGCRYLMAGLYSEMGNTAAA
jgi:predicted Zn-dependent protease